MKQTKETPATLSLSAPESFTGGEWYHKHYGKTFFSHGNALIETDKQVICRLMQNDYDTDYEAEANAALISNAPKMLNLLKEVFNEYQKDATISVNCLAEWLSLKQSLTE